MTTHQQEDGRDYDRDGILKDGERYRRPMTLMDAEQQDVAAITRAALASAYPSPSGALHRPGTVIGDGVQAEIAATERDVRRNLRLDELSTAWKNPPPEEVQKDNAPVADVEAAAAARDQRLQDAWKGPAA